MIKRVKSNLISYNDRIWYNYSTKCCAPRPKLKVPVKLNLITKLKKKKNITKKRPELQKPKMAQMWRSIRNSIHLPSISGVARSSPSSAGSWRCRPLRRRILRRFPAPHPAGDGKATMARRRAGTLKMGSSLLAIGRRDDTDRYIGSGKEEQKRYGKQCSGLGRRSEIVRNRSGMVKSGSWRHEMFCGLHRGNPSSPNEEKEESDCATNFQQFRTMSAARSFEDASYFWIDPPLFFLFSKTYLMREPC